MSLPKVLALPKIPATSASSVFSETVPIRKNEPSKAYQALLDYCVMGFSIGELSTYYQESFRKDPTFVVPATITELRGWQSKFDWNGRRNGYQMRLAAARERVLNQNQDSIQVRLSVLSGNILNRVEEMLAHPLVVTEEVEVVKITADMVGQEIVSSQKVMPAEWTVSTIATLVNSLTTLEDKQATRLDRMITALRRQGFKVEREDEAHMGAIEALEMYESMPKLFEAG
jgi:hypothetical protein